MSQHAVSHNDRSTPDSTNARPGSRGYHDDVATREVSCVVIGGGLAGLIVASELHKRGRDVVVVEARDRVGGRVLSSPDASGDTLDLGGQWLNPGHDRLTELVEACGLELESSPTGDAVVKVGSEVRRLTAAETDHPSPELTPFEVADLGQGLLRLRRLADRAARNQTWVQANSAWLEQSLSRWLRANIRTTGGQEAFHRVMGRALGGQLADELTLAQALPLLAGRDLDSLATMNGEVTQRRVRGGAGQVAQNLAQQLGDLLIVGDPVVQILRNELDPAHAGIVVVTASGKRLRARDVVLALPPKVVGELDISPALANSRTETVAGVSRGSVIKAALVYPTPWWRERGLSGQVSVDAPPVRVMSDATPDGPNSSGHGVLMGFFVGRDVEEFTNLSPRARKAAFHDAVCSTLGAASGGAVPDPIDYLDLNWAMEPFTGGCHGAHFAPSVWTSVAAGLSTSEGRLHFAGAEYSPRFTGYMEGAVRSALAVVDRLKTHTS